MAVQMTQNLPATPAAESTPDLADKTPRSLAEWVEKLNDKGMPAFARTIKDIAGIASDRESSAAELSRVILQDAAMTARLLRVANSPVYCVSQSGRSISTVSRAVVLLGFDTVRSLCVSIAVIDALNSSAQKTRVSEHMARSFHAAVQARAFAIKRRDPSPEEVFIATLLSNIGDLAFWSLKSDTAPKLDAALQHPGCDRARTERAVLGFELDELSLGLARKWNLGKLLENTLENKGDKDPRVSNVRLAQELAQKAESGWDTPEIKTFMGRVAEALYMPLQDVTKLVHANANEAAKTAQYFGVGVAGDRIPLPDGKNKPAESRSVEVLRQEVLKQEFALPDPMLQLTILRELSGMLDGKHDINLLLEMVLEGISRGIGMDRALFAMLNPERTRLRARYALGWDKEDMREKFLFDISPLKANIFSHALETSAPLWFGGPDADPRLLKLMTPDVSQLTGKSQFFVMAVEINGRSIGLFYADRKSSNRDLDEDSYSAFRHFCQQANLALAQSRRGR